VQSKLTQQQVQVLSNPMTTRQYVYFLGGDEKRRKGEQTIEEQASELQDLETEIQLARVGVRRWVNCRIV